MQMRVQPGLSRGGNHGWQVGGAQIGPREPVERRGLGGKSPKRCPPARRDLVKRALVPDDAVKPALRWGHGGPAVRRCQAGTFEPTAGAKRWCGSWRAVNRT